MPQLRHSGPGGAFLLFTTRQHQLHTVSLAALADGTAASLLSGMAGAGGGQAGQQQQQQHALGAPQEQQQGFLKAMRAAMRPAAGAAAGVTVRSVEQNALLVAVPPGAA